MWVTLFISSKLFLVGAHCLKESSVRPTTKKCPMRHTQCSLLWSVIVYAHSKMEFTCFIWKKNGVGSEIFYASVRTNQNVQFSLSHKVF